MNPIPGGVNTMRIKAPILSVSDYSLCRFSFFSIKGSPPDIIKSSAALFMEFAVTED